MTVAAGAFVERLLARARQTRRRIVLPEVGDPRVMAARERIAREGIAELVEIDPGDDPRAVEVAELILERRRRRGVTPAEAREAARDPIVLAAGLVALGHADGCVAGATCSTAKVVRAGLWCVGAAPGLSVVSSTFLMVRGDTVLSYADAGVVPEPDPAQLADIAATTADNHALLAEHEPRVAFLSFSTKGSAEHRRVDKVRAALALLLEKRPDLCADGELQFDAACVPEVAEQKAPGSPVAGRANVLIFPDLDAGNIAYKITQRLAGFEAFGPIVQGLAKPCLDLSRGCTADDVVTVTAIAALLTR